MSKKDPEDIPTTTGPQRWENIKMTEELAATGRPTKARWANRTQSVPKQMATSLRPTI